MEAKNCDHATRLRLRNWFFSSLLEKLAMIRLLTKRAPLIHDARQRPKPTVLTSSAPSLPGEALSASSIQGTNSNLNKLLSVEASTDHQVRRKESSQPP